MNFFQEPVYDAIQNNDSEPLKAFKKGHMGLNKYMILNKFSYRLANKISDDKGDDGMRDIIFKIIEPISYLRYVA